MKIILLIATFVSLLLSAETKNSNVQDYISETNKKINKVLAKVDNITIKQRHVDAQVASKLQKTFFHKSISKEKREEYNKEALEDLINKELLFAYSKGNNINVDKEILDNIEQTIRKRFKSNEIFEQKLKLSHLTLEELRRDINIQEILKLLYAKKIEINLTQKDLEEYYEKNKYKYLRPEAKKVQIITVSIDPSVKDGLKIAQDKANEVFEKVTSGEDFEKMAEKYSDDMSRIKGGNLGYVHKGTFEHIDKYAYSLKNGEISKLIKEDIGFFILKVTDTKAELQIPFKKVEKKLRIDIKKKREKNNLLKILESQKKLMKVVLF